MAAVFILIGSVLGFAGGMSAFFGFDASTLTALSIWIGSGPLAALMVVLITGLATTPRNGGQILAKVA